jgi:predicted nucleic acid-binding protein
MDDQAPVFADAGPLIILGRAGHLWLLRALFGHVYITPVVKEEVLPGKSLPGEVAIQEAIAGGYIIPVASDPPPVTSLPRGLHRGERSTIEAGIAMPDALLLLDDLDARRCAANLGLAHTGSIGAIVLAKQAGHVQSIGHVLEMAMEHGLFIAPSLVKSVLAKAGESLSASLAARLRRHHWRADPGRKPSWCSRLRERLVESKVAVRFFDAVVGEARKLNLLSDENFTFDGVLLKAWPRHRGVCAARIACRSREAGQSVDGQYL